MKRLTALIGVLLLLAGCAEATPTPPLVINTVAPTADPLDNPLREEGTVPNQDGYPREVEMNAIVDLPPGYLSLPEDAALPVLLFLHDDGLQGTDISLMQTTGRPDVMANNPGDYPFIIVIPQLPGDYTWSDFPRTLQVVLEAVHEQYATDRDQVYMAGHGLGGYGVLDLARGLPRLFTAGVVSGGFYVGQASELCAVDVPLRLYHGTADLNVPLYSAERVSGALEDCGIEHTFTVFEELDHAQTADAVYEDAATYDWLLEQGR
jgi:predicted peptidase